MRFLPPILFHRIGRYFFLRKIPFVPRLFQEISRVLNNCDLPASVKLGLDVNLQHNGLGCVFHNKVTIEDRVWINPHVVFGQNTKPGNSTADDMEIVVREGAMIGAGAKIIASRRLVIGRRAVVGANAVVLDSVPDDTTAVGVPARLIKK